MITNKNDKTKIKVTQDILVDMEKASRLRVVTGFERSLLADRVGAVNQYSKGAVITSSQLEVIREMARRYDSVVGTGLIDEEDKK
jgi:hypothetical protein